MELTNEAYYPEFPRATPALAGDSQLGGVGEVRMSPEKSMKHPWKYGAQELERQHAPCAVPCSVGLPAKGQRPACPQGLINPLGGSFPRVQDTV